MGVVCTKITTLPLRVKHAGKSKVEELVDTSALVVAEHIAGIDEKAPVERKAEDKTENAAKSAKSKKARASAKNSDVANDAAAHPNAVEAAGEGASRQASVSETHPQVGKDSSREDSRRSSFIMPTLKLCDKAEHRSVSEPIKIFLNAGKVPYEFELMQGETWDDWLDQHTNVKPPILFVNETMNTEATALARYVVTEFVPKYTTDDAWEMAKMDMMMETFVELRNATIKAVNVKEELVKSNFAKFRSETLKHALDMFSAAIQESNHNCIIGRETSWVDVCVGDYLYTLQQQFEPKLLDGHSVLQKFVKSILKLPRIGEYIICRDLVVFD